MKPGSEMEKVYCAAYKEGRAEGKASANKEYAKLAQRTSPTKTKLDKLIHGALGLTGEAGEFADIIKKWRYQGHELDRDHAIKELGDILWYIAEAAEGLGTDLGEIMAVNIEKQEARYPDLVFKAEHSKNRKEDDK